MTDASDLFRQHAGFVAAFVRRAGGVNEGEVDDVVQDVFVMAARKGGYASGAMTPRTWLAEIALGIVRNRRRYFGRRRHASMDALESVPSNAPSPYERASQTETLARVQAAIDALDDKHRPIFHLFEIAGESCEAIAAALHLPIGTVHSRLSTARARFKEALAREGGP